MITAPTFTIKGIEAEKTNLPEKVFGIEASPKLLTQAVRVYLSNQRRAHAKTKTRGEVIKTTAKMYKQKGTGRARHGSYSAPIFVGGGIAHGPTGTQNYKMSMPAKMAKLALLGSLSDKAKNKAVVVISETAKSSGKTKEAAALMEKVLEGKKALMITADTKEMFSKGCKNIKNLTVIGLNTLNTYEVIKSKKLVLTTEAVKELTKKYVA